MSDSDTKRNTIKQSRWIQWARALQAIGQTGFHYSDNPYDRERYEQIQKISAEIIAHQSNLTEGQVIELNAAEFGHSTPKVDVRGVVFKDAKILLVSESSDQGRWTLPGGWADVNETPSQAVVREVFEESGFETQVVKLLAVYDREKQGHEPPFPYHVYKVFFLCQITGGAARTNYEINDIAFFAENEFPELSVTRVTEKQLHRFFEFTKAPDLPTDYD